MGLREKLKAKAEARREAEVQAALRRAEADAAKKAAEEASLAAFRAEQDLDPGARVALPEWTQALEKADVDPNSIQDVLEASLGKIWTPGTGTSGVPDMQSPSLGVVVLTEGTLAYAFRPGRDTDVGVVVRSSNEVAELRKVDRGGAIQVVFKRDRSFPDRGNQFRLADFWEVTVPPRDEVRDAFRRAGCDV